jgi:hypothetical protein
MSDRSKPDAPAATNAANAANAVAVGGERRPYRAPSLRRLGCVRDLALGGASGVAEGAGTFGPRKMM